MFGLEMNTQTSPASKSLINILDGLSGKFNSSSNLKELLKDYDENDLTKIYADFLKIKESTFMGMKKDRKYAFTRDTSDAATNFINLFRSRHGYVSLDLNRSYLPSMSESHKKQPLKSWQNASEFINKLLFEIALHEGYNIVDGSQDDNFYEKKLNTIHRGFNYSTYLCHFTNVDAVRSKKVMSSTKMHASPNYIANLDTTCLSDVEWINSYLQKQKTILTTDFLGNPTYRTFIDTVLASTVKNFTVSNAKVFIAICNKEAHHTLEQYYS